MTSDIRKWFMKHNDKGNANTSATKSANPSSLEKPSSATSKLEISVRGGQESSCRKKSSPYFASDKKKPKDEKEIKELSAKRKVHESSSELKMSARKKIHKVDENDDEDFVLPNSKRKGSVDVTPNKKLKSGLSKGVNKKSVDIDESDEDNVDNTDTKSHPKSS